MLKNLGISCIIAMASVGLAKSEQGFIQIPVNDTIGIETKDSITAPALLVKDPKEGFKDLFASSSTLSNGVTIAQLNPLAINFVEDYIDSHSKMLEKLRDRSRPYFDMMDAVLTKHGLPNELKYLAVIESQLKTNTKSWAGAAGPWQLMPATGRHLGLKIGKTVDERRDVYKSTHAASRYLTSLYSLYGDWLLVIAAYNGGPGKVNSAIKKSGSRDFWTLQKYLPAESRKHVKKFIATHYIMEGAGGITTLTKKETANFLLSTPTAIPSKISSDLPLKNSGLPLKEETGKSISQIINGRYNASVIAKYIAMNIADFYKINPGFDNEVASSGKYEMQLPSEKMDIFKSKKIDILKDSIQLLLNPETASSTTL